MIVRSRITLCLFTIVLCGVCVNAQNPTVATPLDHFGWDQVAPDLPSAQGYTYQATFDASATAVTLTGVTCSGTASPFQCQSNWPTLTSGAHTVSLVSCDAAGCSAASSVLNFPFVNVPAVAQNLGIRK